VRQTSIPDPRVFDVLRGPEALVFLVADGVLPSVEISS